MLWARTVFYHCFNSRLHWCSERRLILMTPITRCCKPSKLSKKDRSITHYLSTTTKRKSTFKTTMTSFLSVLNKDTKILYRQIIAIIREILPLYKDDTRLIQICLMHSMINHRRWQIQCPRQMSTKITLIWRGFQIIIITSTIMIKIITRICAPNKLLCHKFSRRVPNNKKISNDPSCIEIQILNLGTHLISEKVARSQPFKRLLKWPSTLWQRSRNFSRAIKRRLVSFWAKTRWLKCWNKTSLVKSLRKKWKTTSELSLQNHFKSTF